MLIRTADVFTDTARLCIYPATLRVYPATLGIRPADRAICPAACPRSGVTGATTLETY